jgi:hypothetical protein
MNFANTTLGRHLEPPFAFAFSQNSSAVATPTSTMCRIPSPAQDSDFSQLILINALQLS